MEYEKSGKALRDVLESLFPDEVDEPPFIKRVKINVDNKNRDEIGMGDTFMSIRTCNSNATNVVDKVVLPMIKRMFPKAKIAFVRKPVCIFQKTSKIQNHQMVIVRSLEFRCTTFDYLENFNCKQYVKDMDEFLHKKKREWQNIR